MAWTVEAHDEDLLRCRLPARVWPSGFPFRYEARQEFRLGAEGLSVVLSIRNTGATAMPAGLGLHPYFQRRRGTHIEFVATGFWTPPQRDGGAPGLLAGLPGELGTGSPAALPDNTLDHSFTGFAGGVTITGEGPPIVLRSDAPILHVFAPAGADYFCLEPVSHLPGEFPRAARLRPGDSLSLSMSIGRG
jgi:aldose 1-epimerase